MFILVAGSCEGFLWYAIKNRARLWEASAVAADVRMLAGNLDGERRIAEMVGIAESREVRQRALETLRRGVGVTQPEKILSTLKAERVDGSDLVRIKVVSQDEMQARATADVVTSAFLLRCAEIPGNGDTMRIVRSAESDPVDTLGSRTTLFLYGWPVLMVSLGLEIGHLLGRHLGARRKQA